MCKAPCFGLGGGNLRAASPGAPGVTYRPGCVHVPGPEGGGGCVGTCPLGTYPGLHSDGVTFQACFAFSWQKNTASRLCICHLRGLPLPAGAGLSRLFASPLHCREGVPPATIPLPNINHSRDMYVIYRGVTVRIAVPGAGWGCVATCPLGTYPGGPFPWGYLFIPMELPFRPTLLLGGGPT